MKRSFLILCIGLLLLAGCTAAAETNPYAWDWEPYSEGDGTRLAMETEEGGVITFEIFNWHLYDSWEDAYIEGCDIPTVNGPSKEPGAFEEIPYEIQADEKLLMVTVLAYNQGEQDLEGDLETALTTTSGEPAESKWTDFYLCPGAMYSDKGDVNKTGSVPYTVKAGEEPAWLRFGYILQQDQVEALERGELGFVLTEKLPMTYLWEDDQRPLRLE